MKTIRVEGNLHRMNDFACIRDEYLYNGLVDETFKFDFSNCKRTENKSGFSVTIKPSKQQIVIAKCKNSGFKTLNQALEFAIKKQNEYIQNQKYYMVKVLI